MANLTLIQNSWAAGELSPYLQGRIDLDVYKASARTLENFVPTRQGTLRRRPGTRHIGSSITSGRKSRLFEYVDTSGVAYVIELSGTATAAEGKARAYKLSTHAQVGSDLTTQPWLEAELPSIRYVVNKGVLWLVHPNWAPRCMSISGTTLSINTPTFSTNGTATMTIATPCVVTQTNHGFATGRAIQFSTSGALPTGLAAFTTYYVKKIDANTFNLCATLADADAGTNLIATSGSQSGTHTLRGTVNFGSSGNYPSAVAFMAGRLVLAATTNNPTTLWASRPPNSVTGADRYTEFMAPTGTDTTDSYIAIQESDMGGTSIKWIVQGATLILATDRATWSETAASKPTGADFDLQVSGYNGSAAVQGAITENVIAYVSANGKQLRIIQFSLEKGGMQDVEISKMCGHILSPGISDLRVQTDPDPIVWLVRTDGVLVSITLDLNDGVVAPARHILGGTDALVESIAINRGTYGDEVWLMVNRDTGTRTLEYFYFREDTDTTAVHFVDSGLVLTPASATVTGLTHLNGKVVAAVGDSASDVGNLSVLPEKTVTGNQVVYDRVISNIHIGYPYHSTLLMPRPEVPANGTSQGKKKRIEDVTLRVIYSAGGSAGQALTTLNEIIYLTAGSYQYGNAPGLFSGDVKMDFSGTIDENGDVYIVQEAPMPFNLLAAMTKVAIMEA